MSARKTKQALIIVVAIEHFKWAETESLSKFVAIGLRS